MVKTGETEIKEIRIESAAEMTQAVLEELENKYDLLISAAAISDFTLQPSESKLTSATGITLKLEPATKLLEAVRLKHPDLKMVGFKAETNLPAKELTEKALALQKRYNLILVAANDTAEGGMGGEENHLYLVKRGGLNENREIEVEEVQGNKRELAAALFDILTPLLEGRDDPG